MTAPTAPTADSTDTTEHEEPPMTTTEVPLPPATQATSTTDLRPAGLRRTLPGALRGEWIKATTVRANKALLAVAAIVGLLISWATAAFAADTFATDGALTASQVFVLPTLLTARCV